MEDHKPYLFISYARADDELFVERLSRDLEARDVAVWWDRRCMNNRGLSFLEEIQRAIESVDRVIAVVGPKAVTSDYVRYEWEYALLFGKGLIPILRDGDYSLLPSDLERDLRRDHCPDFRQDSQYNKALEELVRIVSEPVLQLGPIRATPALPFTFLARRGSMDEIRRVLFSDFQNPKPVASPSAQTLVLHGMGGSGKSVLAAAFARSIHTRRTCKDGIVWFKVGRDSKEADLLANLRLLGSAFDDESKFYIDENQACARVSQVLADKRCLIVLDDVWRMDLVEPFLNALGPGCRLLITTRDAALAILGQSQGLDVLADGEALALLAKSTRQPVDALPPIAKEVAEECGNLPLGLAMIGAMVGGNPDRWNHALHRLRTADLAKIKARLPNYDEANLFRPFEVSVDDLDHQHRARYLDLAVFPNGATIPEDTLGVFWESQGVARSDAPDLIDMFLSRSLAGRSGTRGIMLHDLQSDYIRGQISDPQALNSSLLDAYAKHCMEGWPSGPDDGYFFQFLPYHLCEAGKKDALRSLLLDYHWIQAKLEATNVIELIADYGFLENDPDTELVREALQLSATCLLSDKTQAQSQVYARLLPFTQSSIQALVQQVDQYEIGSWLRALTPTLTLPGGSLVRTLVGHQGFVNGVTIFDGGRRAISASDDSTVRVWDLERGIELMKFSDHSNVVTAVAVTADGKRAISAPWDYTFKVWDLNEGKELRTFKGHRAKVTTLLVTQDDRFAISAASDKTIKIWNLETGANVGTLEGHSREVTGLAMSPDGKCLISGSADGSLIVWDFVNQKEIRTLRAHERMINAVAIFPDGQTAISGSTDNTLKVWKLGMGELVCVGTEFYGYDYANHPVAISPDGSRVVFGDREGAMVVWDLQAGSARTLQDGHSAWITSVDVFPDGHRAISSSGDKTIKIWDLDASAQSQPSAHAYWVTSIAFKPDGKQVISASPRDGLKVWDVENLQLVRSIQVPAPERIAFMSASSGMSMSPGDFLAFALFPDGQRCAWALQDGSVRVSDLDDQRELARLDGSVVTRLAVTPDQRHVICLSRRKDGGEFHSSEEVWIWDWQANQVRCLISAADGVFALKVSPDGRKLLASSSFGHKVTAWDLPGGNQLHSFVAHTDAVGDIAFSSDCRRAFSVSRDQTIRIWDLESGQEMMTLRGHTAEIYAVMAFPDGRRILSCSEDCSLKIWDHGDGRNIATFSGDVPLHCCAVSPDGNLIVAGDNLGRVHFLALAG